MNESAFKSMLRFRSLMPRISRHRMKRTLLRGRTGSSNGLFCELVDDEVHALYVRRGPQGVEVDRSVVLRANESTHSHKRLDGRGLVVALLPRSQYMLRLVEVPNAQPGEMEAMLRLEVEASLPGGHGPVEISYRELPGGRDGYRRYETYVARSESVENCLSRLRARGIRPQVVLPSAVVWREALEENLDLLVAEGVGERKLETAFVKPDGSLSVRTLEEDPSREVGFSGGLTECVRVLLGHSGGNGDPLRVGWIGKNLPRDGIGERAFVEEVGESRAPQQRSAFEGNEANTRLLVAARVFADPKQWLSYSTVNLLPRKIITAQRRRSVYRQFALGAALVVLALCLIQTALSILTMRYERELTGALDGVAKIGQEGETLGRQVKQLEAVGLARETQGDFRDILEGLYAATPSGITYSHIEKSPEGGVSLRGQAESMAMPFLLPQALEKHPSFEHVLLKDAGQLKRSEGTVTEFHVAAHLRR